MLLGGGAAGVANWLVALPVDTLKSRLQAHVAAGCSGGGGGAPPPPPPGLAALARQLLREEGVRGLYRGLGPALLRAVPANAACFGGMEAARAALDRVM